MNNEVRIWGNNKATLAWIIGIVIFLIIAGLISKKVTNTQKAQGVYPVVNRITFPKGVSYQEFDLDPNGWILVKIPQGRYRYFCPEGMKIRLPNGAEIINSYQRYDRLGKVFWLKGSGKARFTRIVKR